MTGRVVHCAILKCREREREREREGKKFYLVTDLPPWGPGVNLFGRGSRERRGQPRESQVLIIHLTYFLPPGVGSSRPSDSAVAALHRRYGSSPFEGVGIFTRAGRHGLAAGLPGLAFSRPKNKFGLF